MARKSMFFMGGGFTPTSGGGGTSPTGNAYDPIVNARLLSRLNDADYQSEGDLPGYSNSPTYMAWVKDRYNDFKTNPLSYYHYKGPLDNYSDGWTYDGGFPNRDCKDINTRMVHNAVDPWYYFSTRSGATITGGEGHRSLRSGPVMAALVSLITDDNTTMEKVRQYLVNQSNEPLLTFDTSQIRWNCVQTYSGGAWSNPSRAGWDQGPCFYLAEYCMKFCLTYDYAKGYCTDDEKTIIRNRINHIGKYFRRNLEVVIIREYFNNQNTVGDWFTANYDNFRTNWLNNVVYSGVKNRIPGDPKRTHQGTGSDPANLEGDIHTLWNNRAAAQAKVIYLAGCLSGDQELIDWGEAYFKNCITYGTFSDNTFPEAFRGPYSCIGYGTSNLYSLMEIADFQKNFFGSTELYDFTTTGGITGVLHNSSGTYATDNTGVEKSLLKMVKTYSRYWRQEVDGGFSRQLYEGGVLKDCVPFTNRSWGSGKVSTHYMVFPFFNHYYQDSDLEKFATLDTTAGYPGWQTYSNVDRARDYMNVGLEGEKPCIVSAYLP